MNNITYIGPFKDHIQSYVKLKQAVGYKFHTDASHLKRFDYNAPNFSDHQNLKI